MAAPTFVAENESVWNTSTTPKTSGSLSVTVGDVLLDCIADEGFTTAENYNTTNSGTAQTWTEVRPALSNNADASVQIHHAIASATQSMTVTATRAAGGTSDWWGHNVLHYTATDGVGATATSATAQSVNLTTTQADSSIVCIVVDWSAGVWGSTTRPWVAVGGVVATEMSYFQSGIHYTIGIARWESVGAAGVKTVGLEGLSGTFAAVAVEVKGKASSSTPGQGSGSGTLAWSGSATGKRSPKGSSSGTVTFTGTASGATVRRGSGSGVLAFVGTATGKRAPKATGSGSLSWSGSASGSAPAVGSAEGSGSGTLAWSGSATGKRTPKASASGSVAWAGSATGRTTRRGSGSGGLAWSGSATGIAPSVDGASGSGSGTLAWAGSAVGKRRPIGSGAGALAFVGTAIGTTVRRGVATGQLAWLGTATGENGAPTVYDLTATPAPGLTVTAAPAALTVASASRDLTAIAAPPALTVRSAP